MTHHGAYVGRVGALAAALGVGAVIAFAPTALADESGAAATAAAPSQSTSGDVGGAGEADSAPKPSATTATEAPSSPVDHESNDQPTGGGGTAPIGTVSAQTNTGTSTRAESEPVPADTTSASSSSDATAPPAAVSSPVGGLTSSRNAAGGHTPTALADTRVPTAFQGVQTDSPTVHTSTAAVAAQSRVVANGAVPLTLAGSAAPASRLAPTPVRDPLGALIAVPVSVVTAVVNAFLAPVFGGVPGTPAEPPLLWAVLGWVRREVERTFVNSTPTATNQSVALTLATTTSVGAPTPFTATDVDGDRLTYAVPVRGTLGGPAHGTVSVDQASGTFTYDPDDAYALTGGTDSFTYTVSDAAARPGFLGVPLSWSSTTATAIVTVTVPKVGTAPTAVGDGTTTAEDIPVTIAVLANDTDRDGDPLIVTGVTQPTSGTVTFTSSGVRYTPNRDFNGTDSFTYTASDGARTGTAAVTVTVTSVNDAPVAVNDTATVAEGGITTVAVTANDTDGDGTVDKTTVVITRQPTAGTATVNGDGTVTYTSNGAEATTDGFDYKVEDTSGALSNEASVSITVTPVNDAPVAVNDMATVVQGGTATITVTANDTDVDGTVDKATVVITRQPTAGTATVNGDGTVTYVSNGSAVTADSFGYKVEDTSGALSNEASVSITVTPVNDTSVGTDPSNADMALHAIVQLPFQPGTYLFYVEPLSQGTAITATTGTGTVVSAGRYYLASTGQSDGYIFQWTPTQAGDTPQNIVFTGTRTDGTSSTITYRSATAGQSGGGSTPTTPVDDGSVGTSPHTADMKLYSIREDLFLRDGSWDVRVEPLTPGTTVTATTTSGTIVSGGRYYLLSTGQPDGYIFRWKPATAGDTPQDIVFTATRADGTTSTMTYRSGTGGQSGGGSTPTTPTTPTYTNLIPAVNDPTVPTPSNNAADGSTGPRAGNTDMQIRSSSWDSTRNGYLVVVDVKTAGTVVTATTPENGTLSGYYPGGQGDGYYAYTDGGDTPFRLPIYQFMFYPNDGSNWSSRYPTINLTATRTDGTTSAITFRSPDPVDSGTGTTLDPNLYPPSGPNAKNQEMVISSAVRRTDGSYFIDVIQVPSVIVTAGTPYGGLMRWPSANAGVASYLWTANGTGKPPVIVLTAHYSDGRTTTITYTT